MKTPTPSPSAISLLWQSTAMVLFGLVLYFVLAALQTSKGYTQANAELQRKNQYLSYAQEQIGSYLDLIQNDPNYSCVLHTPQWEKVDETWVDLSYDELLHRLNSLYRQERPFVLDYFSAEQQELDRQAATPAGGRVSQDDGPKEQKRNSLVFHLQGYFLVPCQ